MAATGTKIISKEEEANSMGGEVNLHAGVNLNLISPPPPPEMNNKIERVDINLNSPPPPETKNNKGKAPASEPPQVVLSPLSQRLSSLHPVILKATKEEDRTQAQHQGEGQTQAQTKGTTSQTKCTTSATTSGGADVQLVGRQTAAEVWLEICTRNPHLIARGRKPIHNQNPAQKQPTFPGSRRPAGNQNPSPAQKQPPKLDDMTLEDFLVQAGVVREKPWQPIAGPPQQWPQAYVGQPSRVGPPLVERRTVTMGALPAYRGCPHPKLISQIGVSMMSPNPMVQNSISPNPMVPNAIRPISSAEGGPSRAGSGVRGEDQKSEVDGATKEADERQHMRMTSNRESAARSRARKQAYTDALEGELKQVRGELKQLREENASLKQDLVNIQTELEKKRKRKVRALITIFVAEDDDEEARARPKLLNKKCKELRRTSSSFL